MTHVPRKSIFVSYSHHDQEWLTKLLKVLRPLTRTGSVTLWSDQKIGTGDLWKSAIDQALQSVSAAILLVSPNFLDSDFIYENELPVLLDGAQERGVRIFWVPISASLFEESRIKDYQAAIDPARPLDSMSAAEQNQALVALAKDLRSVLAVETTRTDSAARPKIFHVPVRRNPYFTGRATVFPRIRQQLDRTGTAILCGMGGLGKTQAAVEYAYLHRDEYATVLSCTAETAQTLDAGYAEACQLLSLPGAAQWDQVESRESLKRWLADSGNWLLLLDNADDPALLTQYLPRDYRGHVLITSRAQDFQPVGLGGTIPVQELTLSEADEFLRKRSGRSEFDAAEANAILTLAGELGSLPLALEHVGAYVVANGVRFDDYLQAYGQRQLKLFQNTAGGTPEGLGSLTTVWSMNFDRIEENPAAADLLRLMAFFAPEKIPLEIPLRAHTELGEHLSAALAGVEHDPLPLFELLRDLTRYSLVRRDVADRSCSIHRLVQRVLRDRLDKNAVGLWTVRALRALNRVYPEVEYSTWRTCERLTPHVLALLPFVDEVSETSRELGRLLNQAAYYADDRGRYEESENLYRRARTIREIHRASHPLEYAETLNDFGYLLGQVGRFEEAEPLYREAVSLRERELSPDHLEVATTLNNWAMLCRDQHRFAEAEPMFARSLAIRIAGLGPDHPRVAASMNNLAKLYHYQLRHEEAERLYTSALEIRRAALGPDHPRVAATLKNLAELWKHQQRYADAETYYEGALAIRVKTLGPEHPHVAETLEGYADLLEKTGAADRGRRMRQQAETIMEGRLTRKRLFERRRPQTPA